MISTLDKNGKLYLKYNSRTLAVIKKDVLLAYLTEDKKDVPTKKTASTKKTKLKTQRSKPTSRTVESFIKNFYTMKEKFYNKKLPKPKLNTTSKEYKLFRDATKLAYELDVNTKTFIKAQVDGLSFVNNGRGQFPKPNQLTGENAINRVLDYTRKINTTEDDVVLEDKDMYIPIQENVKYKRLSEKIKKQTASLDEAYYVMKVEKHFHGNADMETEVYIEVMREDVG